MGNNGISLEKTTALAAGAGLAGLFVGGPIVGGAVALTTYGVSTLYNLMT